MDRTHSTLTALLLDPFLTLDEAQREACAVSHAVAPRAEPSSLRRVLRSRPVSVPANQVAEPIEA
jgi:Mn-dependent DtxR family transcriptional regulator